MMKTSAVTRAKIEEFEGLRLHTYYDIVGVATIGYGHTGLDVSPGQRITQAQADAFLAKDLEKFERGVHDLCSGAATTQGQFDAMVCLSYNIGLGKRGGKGGLANSSILRHHLAGEYDDAADAFMLYDKAGGRIVDALARRRQWEGQLYMDASP